MINLPENLSPSQALQVELKDAFYLGFLTRREVLQIKKHYQENPDAFDRLKPPFGTNWATPTLPLMPRRHDIKVMHHGQIDRLFSLSVAYLKGEVTLGEVLARETEQRPYPSPFLF